MTSPNYNDPNQMPDAVNAGDGISGAASTPPGERMQGGFNQIGGPLGAVASWLLGGLAEQVIEDAEESVASGATESYTNAAGKTMARITGARANVTNPLVNILQGITAGLSPELAGLAGFMGSKWGKVADIDNAVSDLQDKTQVLEGVIGHASAYMSSNPGTTTTATRMPFTTQAGPLVGVENLGDGRWRLLSRGSWDISAQVEFWGGLLMPPGTYMRIVTRDPSGAVFKRRTAKADSVANVTVTNVDNVVVPAAGYTVEVEAWTDDIPLVGGTFRGISGGYETTGLYIRKVSSETS